MLKRVHDGPESAAPGGPAAGSSLLDEIVRDGARRMLAAALQAEVTAYVDPFVDEVDENGHRLVVRNGYHEPREVVTAAGAVPVRQPRVDDKRVDPETGERARFASSSLPAWARTSPGVAEVLPLLYLHGLSSQDFGPALEPFLGSAQGRSAAPITRLTSEWQTEAMAFNQRSLAGSDDVSVWADGIHLKVRLAQDKVCLLVIVGVRADGAKELVALADGHRESTESWADLLRSCTRRGMRAPVLAVGDGALGFWAALRDGFPETRAQRCWFHKIADALNALPESAPPGARAALAEIWNAEGRDHAQAAARTFADAYGTKWAKAAARITDDLDVPLAFYDYPAEHWIHLRTTNPIESTFATIRLRQRVTEGPGSRAAGIAVAFKRIESAQRRRRAVDAPHLVALVRAGADEGRIVERPATNRTTSQEMTLQPRDRSIGGWPTRSAR
jgi:transposase-like protein